MTDAGALALAEAIDSLTFAVTSLWAVPMFLVGGFILLMVFSETRR